VTHNSADSSRDEITRELRRLFPRHTDIVFNKPETAAGAESAVAFKPQADHRTTIREFLANDKDLAIDPDKGDILSLAEKFLAVEANS
jgi:hypothetical protein